MRIGFTGSREGMPTAQRESTRLVLTDLCSISKTDELEFHHGDCVGSDEEAHRIALTLRIPIFIHPPINLEGRAVCSGYYWIENPKGYLDRNRDIAAACDVLVATPKQSIEVTRSGTWATVRYARKLSKKILIIHRNGEIYENEGIDEYGYQTWRMRSI